MKEITLENANGVRLRVSELGGIVRTIEAPDRAGNIDDITLGFDSAEAYSENPAYFGALIGRYGNRIARGSFELDGNRYTLATNDGANHLHGGERGFDKATWDIEPVSEEAYTGVQLRYASPDGEEGYPGKLVTTVVYKLTDENEWVIEYAATTDKTTVLNLTHHAYFNLGGHGAGSILDHRIRINADAFTPVDTNLIPTGEIRSVEDTPMDFREPTEIGGRIGANDDQLLLGKGYDHNFVLNKDDCSAPSFAAEVYDPKSGRVLEVFTTEPGMQFYTGNFLDGSLEGKGGARYSQRTGFCLETQRFPDSPNQHGFPSVRLEPGQPYRSTTIYRFSAR